MSTKVILVYPLDCVKFEKGTGPLPDLNADYVYSEQQQTWQVIGNNVSVKKKLPSKVAFDDGCIQEILEEYSKEREP